MGNLASKGNRTQKLPASAKARREVMRGPGRDTSPIPELQRTVGNQAVLRLLQANATEARQPQEASLAAESAERNLEKPPDGEGIWAKVETASSVGSPLDPAIRGWFEKRLGETLGDVRVHRGPQADAATRNHGALAATVGRDIAVNSSVAGPTTPQGQFVLAHELVHVIQQRKATGLLTESQDASAEEQAHALAPSLLVPGQPPLIHRVARPAVMFLTAASGQYVTSSTGEITADVSSPVVIGREVRIQVDIGPAATYPQPALLRGPYPYYIWKVFDRDTNTKIAETWSAMNHWTTSYSQVGHFRVECVYMDPTKGGTPALTINQDAVAEDPGLSGVLSSDTDYAEAERELVDDFLPYVKDAAAATGAQGITARFLAAILREEIANTAGRPTFLASLLGTNKASRAGELSDVEGAIQKKARGATVATADINKSVGVGQVRLSTAAMSQGLIPWTEQDPQNRQPARTKIETDFGNLSSASMSDLLTLLAWPKSNIAAVATTLAKLKNRASRYPSVTRAAFGASQRACEIIATEYNLGATTSPEPVAAASDYGKRIWSYMSLQALQKFFPNS